MPRTDPQAAACEKCGRSSGDQLAYRENNPAWPYERHPDYPRLVRLLLKDGLCYSCGGFTPYSPPVRKPRLLARLRRLVRGLVR